MSTFAKTIVSSTCRLIKNSANCTAVRGTSVVNASPKSPINSSLSRRNFCRLTHHLGTVRGSSPRTFLVASCVHRPSCYLHTEGDSDFSKYLEEEIKNEKKPPSALHQLESKGWAAELDGVLVKLQKQLENETLTVKLNVNFSEMEDYADHSAEDPDAPPNLVCQPPFTIEIKKQSGMVISADCVFTSAEPDIEEDAEPEGENRQLDKYQLEEIAIHDGEIKESTYAARAENMDSVMYDHIMDMLFDRGFDDSFVDSLTKFATAYEQEQYRKFLDSLKKFVDEV